MEITKKTRNQIRLQNIVFIVLFATIITLLAWLSNQYSFESDLTENNKNTLSKISIKLLQQLPEPIIITTFIPDGNLISNRQYIKELVAKYQKHKNNIT